jgi:DNA-directed RNA polymerase specialized sigma24 family protein
LLGNSKESQPYELEDAAFGLSTEDAQRVLNDALATLSENLRVTFSLRINGGLSYRDIAQALEIPIGTVMSRLHCARLQLQDFIRTRSPRAARAGLNGIRRPCHVGMVQATREAGSRQVPSVAGR